MHFKAFFNPVFGGILTKTLLIMKLTAIFLLAACLNVSAKGYVQRITLVAKNAPLEQVLKKIKEQSGYHVVYREEWMAESKRVTVTLKDVSLQDALNECFKNQPFDYSLVEKTIVLKEKPPAKKDEIPINTPAPFTEITGSVTDENDNPIQGVNVNIKGTNKGTATDANGKFSIDVPAKGVLVFSSVGYITQE